MSNPHVARALNVLAAMPSGWILALGLLAVAGGFALLIRGIRREQFSNGSGDSAAGVVLAVAGLALLMVEAWKVLFA